MPTTTKDASARLDPLAGYACRCGVLVRWETTPWPGWPRVVAVATGDDHACTTPRARHAMRPARPLPGEQGLAQQTRLVEMLATLLINQADTDRQMAAVAARLVDLHETLAEATASHTPRHPGWTGTGGQAPSSANGALPPVVAGEVTVPVHQPPTSIAELLLYAEDEAL